MGSKYRNIKVEIEGYKFDSKKEAEFYQELVLRKKAGDIMDFKVKPKIQIFSEQESGKCILGWFWADYRGLTAWQKGVFTYTPDFTIHHRSGQEEIIDCKGVQTPVFKLKRKFLELLRLKIILK